MGGRDIEKLVGIFVKEIPDKDNSISITIVDLDDDEEFNSQNVGDLLFKVFPRNSVKKNIENMQQDLLNYIMLDGLIEMQNKKK